MESRESPGASGGQLGDGKGREKKRGGEGGQIVTDSIKLTTVSFTKGACDEA